MIANIHSEGQNLIQELKEHILKALAYHHPNGKTGVSVSDLQEFSGLTVKGRGGGGVWVMGFITLLIELVKEGRICSQESRPNTRYWQGSTKV